MRIEDTRRSLSLSLPELSELLLLSALAPPIFLRRIQKAVAASTSEADSRPGRQNVLDPVRIGREWQRSSGFESGPRFHDRAARQRHFLLPAAAIRKSREVSRSSRPHRPGCS